MRIREEPAEYVQIACESTQEILTALGLTELRAKQCLDEFGPEEWGIESPALSVLLALVETAMPAVTVELGTYNGRTASAIGSTLKTLGKGKLFTIDDFRSTKGSISRDKFEKLDLSGVVTQIEQDTTTAFSNWSREQIDLLIIDASHDYLSVCIDFALWSRLVSRNGWIVMHDTQTRLRRRFPQDYIHPLRHYDILEIVDLKNRSASGRWEGVAFLRQKRRAWEEHLAPEIAHTLGPNSWAGCHESDRD